MRTGEADMRQQPSIGLDNGLVPNWWQAMIKTNADPIHWRIYAGLGEDGLRTYDPLLDIFKIQFYKIANTIPFGARMIFTSGPVPIMCKTFIPTAVTAQNGTRVPSSYCGKG